MKILKECIAIVMVMMLLACSGETSSIKVTDVGISNLKKKEDISSLTDTTAVIGSSTEPVLQSGGPMGASDWDKKIIKTAHVTLEIKDYSSFNSDLHNSTKRFAAYIASEQQNETDFKIENVVSIKVPVGEFENLMNTLQPEGAKVLEKRISTEDVSGEMVDTRARLEARKQVRERYLALLKQAKTMKEVLEVQKEINAIQEDIEAGSGRVEYLGHQTAYSTINLTYYQYLNGSKGDDQPSPFMVQLKEAFKDGGSIITGLLLILVTFWPLLVAGFVIWWIIKRQAFKKLTLVKKVE